MNGQRARIYNDGLVEARKSAHEVSNLVHLNLVQQA